MSLIVLSHLCVCSRQPDRSGHTQSICFANLFLKTANLLIWNIQITQIVEMKDSCGLWVIGHSVAFNGFCRSLVVYLRLYSSWKCLWSIIKPRAIPPFKVACSFFTRSDSRSRYRANSTDGSRIECWWLEYQFGHAIAIKLCISDSVSGLFLQHWCLLFRITWPLCLKQRATQR